MRIKPLLPVMGKTPKAAMPASGRVAQRIPTGTPKASKPKRPSGQFAGKAEGQGKVNGAGYADAQHPQSHEAFEKL